MADNGSFRNLISNIEIASIVETVFTNVSWCLAGFPAGQDTTTNAVSTFEDDYINAMILQDGSRTKTGDASSDYNDTVCLGSIPIGGAVDSVISAQGNIWAFGDDGGKTAVQLFLGLPSHVVALSALGGKSDVLGKLLGELKGGRKTGRLFGFAGHQRRDMEVLRHS